MLDRVPNSPVPGLGDNGEIILDGANRRQRRAFASGSRHPRLVSFPELRSRFGIRYSRMHIDRLEKAGRFPRRVRTGPNSIDWVEDEIVEHLENLMAARSARSVA